MMDMNRGSAKEFIEELKKGKEALRAEPIKEVKEARPELPIEEETDLDILI